MVKSFLLGINFDENNVLHLSFLLCCENYIFLGNYCGEDGKKMEIGRGLSYIEVFFWV